MKVRFMPMNVEHEIQPGQSVMHLAEDHGIYIKSVCRGQATCAECRVRVVSGERNAIPPLKEELAMIGSAWFVDGRRLSCQLKCLGDVTVDLSEQVAKAEALKKAGKKSSTKSDRVEAQVRIDDPQILEPEDEADSKPVSTPSPRAPGGSQRGPPSGGGGGRGQRR